MSPLGKPPPLFCPQERSDEEAHRPPAESEVFHGNHQRYYKPFFLINNYKKIKEKSSKR
jgi:hypothetical protein